MEGTLSLNAPTARHDTHEPFKGSDGPRLGAQRSLTSSDRGPASPAAAREIATPTTCMAHHACRRIPACHPDAPTISTRCRALSVERLRRKRGAEQLDD